MTHKDIYTKFMIEYDKANVTSSYPSLTEYEVATLLDKAYLALIARKFTGNNPRQSAFETDIKSIHDLQPLVVRKGIKLDKEGPALNVKGFKIPTECLYYVQTYLQQIMGQNPTDANNVRVVPTKLVPHELATKFFITPYNMPWVKNPVCYEEDGCVYVAYDSVKSPSTNSVQFVYLKKPSPFVLGIPPVPEYEDDDEPDVIINPDDGGQDPNQNGNGDDTGGGQQQPDTPSQDDVYFINITSATKITDQTNKYIIYYTVKKNNVEYTNYSVNDIVWSVNEQMRDVIDLQINKGNIILTVKSEPPLYVVQLTASGFNTTTTKSLYVGYQKDITPNDDNGSGGDNNQNNNDNQNNQDDDNGSDNGGGYIQSGSGNIKVAVFDFSNPESLNINSDFTIPTQSGQYLIESRDPGSNDSGVIFSEGPVTISWEAHANSPVMAYEYDYSTNRMEYYYVMRWGSWLNIRTSGNNYIQSVYVDGSLGSIGQVDSTTGVWVFRHDDAAQIHTLKNGKIYAYIRRLIVTYSEGKAQTPYNLLPIYSNPKNNGVVTRNYKLNDWIGIEVGFNLPLVFVDNSKFKLYRLNSSGQYDAIDAEAKRYSINNYGGMLLINPKKGSNQQLVDGSYELVISPDAVEYGEAWNSEIRIKFTLRTSDPPSFKYTYNWNVLNYLTSRVDSMSYHDLNNIILFVYDSDYDDMVPDPSKEVQLINIHSLGIIETGHFEKYQGEFPIEGNCHAIIFVPDEPFQKDDSRMMNYNHSHTCLYIPEAAFGDSNFGKYLQNPSSVSQSDCTVNGISSSFSFIIERDADPLQNT